VWPHCKLCVICYSSLQDIGAGKGKYYAVNFPLRDGIDDDSYEQTFRPVCSIYDSVIKALNVLGFSVCSIYDSVIKALNVLGFSVLPRLFTFTFSLTFLKLSMFS